MLFNFYLKPVFIASHRKLKKLHLILNSEYANTKLVLSSIMPIFWRFWGRTYKTWEKRLKYFLKMLTSSLFPSLVFSLKNYFAKNPTNFRCARMLHQFVKYVFPEPGRCGLNSYMLHTFELI